MNTVALYVGWIVIVGFAAWVLSVTWWVVGDLIWGRVLPSSWKRAGMHVVYGTLHISPSRLAAMFVLGGPFAVLRAPEVVRGARRRKAARDHAESLKRIEAAEATATLDSSGEKG